MKTKAKKDIHYKAILFDAALELYKIRSLISEEKAKEIRKILLVKKTYKQKAEEFQKYKKDLQKSEKYFLRFIELTNKLSCYKGYKNFIDEVTENAKIPRKNIINFTKELDKIISFLNKKVKFQKETPKEYWSEYYLPFPPHKSQKEYKIEEVYNTWKKTDPSAEEIIKRIKIIKDKNQPSCRYNKEKGIFEIRCDLTKKILPEIFSFMHELGHAKQKSLLIKKKDKTKEIGRYQEEKYAYKFALSLIKKIAPRDELWPYLWFKAKELITNGLFEYLIYTNKTPKPREIYAKVHNIFYKKDIQKENYFYLTVYPLLFQNGDFLTSAIAFIEALKKTNSIR